MLHPPGELSVAQIDEAAVVERGRYGDVQAQRPAVLAGQRARVQRMLDGLQAEGESAVLVHWALASGHPPSSVSRRHECRQTAAHGLREKRIWGPRERLFERVLPRRA